MDPMDSLPLSHNGNSPIISQSENGKSLDTLITKIKIFGWGYVEDFCISLFQNEQEEKAEKIYFAECLRIITENTAKMVGGSYITAKLADILNPKPVDNRTGEEIAADIIRRAGIEVI